MNLVTSGGREHLGPASPRSWPPSSFTPPPSVHVISFFVTSRYAGQSDWRAFLEVVTEQLAETLHQPMPPLLSEATQLGWFSRLLKDAARVCQEKGERLILLVDGLDEDRGVTTGPGAHSIAALLPAVPQHGMRVVVAGRPDPPVPPDVPARHPLRDPGIVHKLMPSSAAQIIRDDAERELDELLYGDVTASNLLGLLVAAGGGLSSRDLAELTALPARAVDKRLRAVSGRTFSSRDSYWRDGARVFVLAHEELQKTAVDALGEATLENHRHKLHAWAGRYRDLGWPPGTPEYLLRGYHRLLQATSDLERMVACATDQGRLDRMLDISGGDASALAEVLTCQTLVCAQPAPDLYAVLALARTREQLADRNAHIPYQLPAAWARLGNPTRAEALARGIPTPVLQMRALTSLMKALAADRNDQAGLMGEHAEKAARTITNPDTQVDQLIMLMTELVAMGDDERARSVTRSVEDIAKSAPSDRTRSYQFARLVAAQVMVGHLERAKIAVTSVTDPEARAEALAEMFEGLTAAGRHDEASVVAQEAIDTVRGIADLVPRTRTLIKLAVKLVAAGQTENAGVLVAEAYDSARSVSDGGTRSHLLAELMTVLAEMGRDDEARTLAEQAEALARSVPEVKRDPSLNGLVKALVKARHFAHAQTLAYSLGPLDNSEAEAARETPRDSALSIVATGLVAANMLPEAAACALDIAYMETRSKVLAELTKGLARAGLLREAEETAESITRPAARTEALAVLVVAAQATGDVDHARLLARRADATANSIDDPYTRSRALMNMVAALTMAGHEEHARQIAGDIESIARAITDPGVETQRLIELVMALTAAGRNDEVSALAEQAATLAATIEEPFARSRALTMLAKELIAAGHLPQAAAIAADIPFLDARNRMLAALVMEFVEAGLLDDAGSLADRIPDPSTHAQALISLLAALIARSDSDAIHKVTSKARLAIGSIGNLDAQTRSLNELVALLAKSGRLDQAESAARSIEDPYAQGRALVALVTSLIATDRLSEAEAMAMSIPRSDIRARTLAELVKGLAAAGRLAHAEEMARLIPSIDALVEAIGVIAKADPGRAARLIAWASTRTPPGMLLMTVAEIDPTAVVRLAKQSDAL